MLWLAWMLASADGKVPRRVITGVVVDRNGAPIARALVSLEPGAMELVTDGGGRFSIEYVRDDSGHQRALTRRFQYHI